MGTKKGVLFQATERGKRFAKKLQKPGKHLIWGGIWAGGHPRKSGKKPQPTRVLRVDPRNATTKIEWQAEKKGIGEGHRRPN